MAPKAPRKNSTIAATASVSTGAGVNAGDACGTEKRRSRNRASQREFRARRDRRLKELEEQVRLSSLSETARNAKLLVENAMLLDALRRVHTQAQRLKPVVVELCDTLANVVGSNIFASAESNASLSASPEGGGGSDGDGGGGDVQTPVPGPLEPETPLPDSLEPEALLPEPLESASNAQQDKWLPFCAANGNDPDSAIFDDWNIPELMAESAAASASSHTSSASTDVDVLAQFLPQSEACRPQSAGIGTVSTRQDLLLEADDLSSFMEQSISSISHVLPQCSPAPYLPNTEQFYLPGGDLLDMLPIVLQHQFSRVSAGQMTISDHLDDTITLAVDYLKLIGGASNIDIVTKVSRMALMKFLEFISPIPTSIWLASYCFNIVQSVIVWRVAKAFNVKLKLPAHFEESNLQSMTAYPALIDWIVFPGLRDQCIRHYNGSRQIDTIFADLWEHAVVEVEDASTILAGVPSGRGYLGVCNIFRAISGTGAGCNNGQPGFDDDDAVDGLPQVYNMPAPDSSLICKEQSSLKGAWTPVPLLQLLSSPQHSRALYFTLELYSSHRTWKIDPAFYEKYPELKWNHYESTLATGVRYRVDSTSLKLLQPPSTISGHGPIHRPIALAV